MTAPKRPPLESLHHALKSWDPVRREGAPAEEEVARWRRRMLAAEGERRRRGAVRWRPVLVSLAAALVLVVLWEGGFPVSSPSPPVERRGEEARTRPGRADRSGAARGEERRTGQIGTPAGAPTAQISEAGAPALGGSQAADGEGGTGGERARPARRHAVDVRRPSAVERPTEGQPEATADGDGTPSGVLPLPSIARTGAAGHPGERIAAGSADAAQPPGGAAGQVESASTSGSPPAAPSPSLRAAASVGAAAPAPAAPPAFREVQIIAPGGTRIVWLVAADPASQTDPSQEDT